MSQSKVKLHRRNHGDKVKLCSQTNRMSIIPCTQYNNFMLEWEEKHHHITITMTNILLIYNIWDYLNITLFCDFLYYAWRNNLKRVLAIIHKTKGMTIRRTAETYNIPISILHFRISEKTGSKSGQCKYLDLNEETKLTNFLSVLGNRL